MNDKFINALHGKAQKTPPIWFMRQAGRYHQHYQNLRQKYSFMELCKNPELAAEVAYGPIHDFDFDVSIMFSDLLFPLEALGLGLSYEPAPRLARSLNSETILQLTPLAEAIVGLEFQRDVLRATRSRLPKNKSLIGFVGGPWTLFTYAVEGEHKGHLQRAKGNGALFQKFSEVIVPLLIANIELQIEGGAEVVMIFDTAAGELMPLHFRQMVAPHLQRLVSLFPQQLGYYAKGVQLSHVQDLIADSRWAGFGFDHHWSLPERLRERKFGFVQGNFDQALLLTDEDQFKALLKNYVAEIKQLSVEERRGWVSGLGHGVLPGTPERAVKAMVDYIREEFA